jgi:hypothetical protein
LDKWKGGFFSAVPRLLTLFIGIRQRPASAAEWHDHFGILKSNGFVVISLSLKQEGVPWPPQKAPCSSKLTVHGPLLFSDGSGRIS